MRVEIACPKCDWEPNGGAHWMCTCGYRWNTFDTYGKCPKCGKVWRDTQCPGPGYPGGCGAWSKHIDWYRHWDSPVKEEIEEILKEKPAVTSPNR